LDFGCGPGDLLASLECANRYGVEIAEASRHKAASKGIDVRPNLVDFDGHKFDRIISSHALEHVVSPVSTLTSMKALLKPDGLLLLLLPINEWVDREQRRWKQHDRNMHLYTWTPLILGNMLCVCQFDPLEVRTVHQWPPNRGISLFAKNKFIYRLVAYLCSKLYQKRQVFAVAQPQNAP